MTATKRILLLYLVLLFLIGLLVFSAIYFVSNTDAFYTSNKVEMMGSYYILGIALSLLVAIVALVNLSSISNSTQADFLLRIDTRWGSAEIVEARTIIHRYYIEVINTQENNCIPITNEGIYSAIGTKILKLHGSIEGDDPKDFVTVQHVHMKLRSDPFSRLMN